MYKYGQAWVISKRFQFQFLGSLAKYLRFKLVRKVYFGIVVPIKGVNKMY